MNKCATRRPRWWGRLDNNGQIPSHWQTWGLSWGLYLGELVYDTEIQLWDQGSKFKILGEKSNILPNEGLILFERLSWRSTCSLGTSRAGCHDRSRQIWNLLEEASICQILNAQIHLVSVFCSEFFSLSFASLPDIWLLSSDRESWNGFILREV